MTSWRLTVKLRGRTTTAESAEGAQSLSARGANPEASHGPLQRLLGACIEPSLAKQPRSGINSDSDCPA